MRQGTGTVFVDRLRSILFPLVVNTEVGVRREAQMHIFLLYTASLFNVVSWPFAFIVNLCPLPSDKLFPYVSNVHCHYSVSGLCQCISEIDVADKDVLSIFTIYVMSHSSCSRLSKRPQIGITSVLFCSIVTNVLY